MKQAPLPWVAPQLQKVASRDEHQALKSALGQ
jgi:hypothetical protein